MMDARTLRRALEGLRDDAEVGVSVTVALPGGRRVTADGAVTGLELTENPALAMQFVTLRASADLERDPCAMLALGMISEDEWGEGMPG